MTDILIRAASALQQTVQFFFHFLTVNYFRQIENTELTNQTMKKHIVILGGSYAGVSTAHRILKQASKIGPLKITLVSPNTDFYWSMASPRGVIPGQLGDEKLFQPIAPGFSKYSTSQFEFVLAKSESLDFKMKTVRISNGETLDYDYLIIATGSHTRGNTPFKGLDTTEETRDALHDFQSEVKNAKTIVIAGAGVTGVEAAGELAFEYAQDKKIVLVGLSHLERVISPYEATAIVVCHTIANRLTRLKIASGPTILEESPASVSSYASKALENLNVDIKLRTKVLNFEPQPNGGGKDLTLSTGEKLAADMYVPTFGLVPNTSYIPASFLNANGSVMVDNFLRVKGAKDVWAIGDVSDVESWQFITCDRQSAHLAKNMITMINNKPPIPYKVAASRMY